jgi:hypothetical protein
MTSGEMRRATDAGEPTNRELLDRIERMDRTLSSFMAEHRGDHALIDSSIGELQRGSILRDERLLNLQRLLPEVAELHDFRVQVQTLSRTAQWIFGGSLLAALASIASLVLSLSHFMAQP